MNGLNEDVLKLHILYLEKHDNLDYEEKELYKKYLDFLSKPFVTVNEGVIRE